MHQSPQTLLKPSRSVALNKEDWQRGNISSQPRLTTHQRLHFHLRIVRKARFLRGRPCPIPRPLLLQLLVKRSFEHLSDVLANNREELPAVEVTTRRDEKAVR